MCKVNGEGKENNKIKMSMMNGKKEEEYEASIGKMNKMPIMMNGKKTEEDDEASIGEMIKKPVVNGKKKEVEPSVGEMIKMPVMNGKRKEEKDEASIGEIIKVPVMNGKKKEEENKASIGEMLMVAAGIGVAVVAGIGFAAWGVSEFFGSTSEEEDNDRKKMKAPGRNGKIINRDDFERDAGGYFRRLHDEKKIKKYGLKN